MTALEDRALSRWAKTSRRSSESVGDLRLWQGLDGRAARALTCIDRAGQNAWMAGDSRRDYGLAAVGRSGRFDVEIDEALDDPRVVQMEISTRRWSFRFGLAAPATLASMLAFLREHNGRLIFAELAVGSFLDAPVLLIKDSELADRFWLRAFARGNLVEFTIASDELTEFADALADAAANLDGA